MGCGECGECGEKQSGGGGAKRYVLRTSLAIAQLKGIEKIALETLRQTKHRAIKHEKRRQKNHEKSHREGNCFRYDFLEFLQKLKNVCIVWYKKSGLSRL